MINRYSRADIETFDTPNRETADGGKGYYDPSNYRGRAAGNKLGLDSPSPTRAIMTNPTRASAGKTPDQPAVWYPGSPEKTDLDFRALVDTTQSCEMVQCGAEVYSALKCARLAANVAPMIVSAGTRVSAWDFTQGGRTAEQFAALVHHLIAARPLQRTFYPAIALNAQNTAWLVGMASTEPDLVTGGFTIQGAQTLIQASQPTVTITGEGLDPVAGTLPAIPPLGYSRDVLNVRGFITRPIQLDVAGEIWSTFLPPLWRATEGMDVALVDLSRPAPLTASTATLVRSAWAPNTTSRLFGFTMFLETTSAITDLRLYPMAGNSQRIGDMLTALGG